VTQVVGLLADLALAEKKVFVIEEPENDLHPGALRGLLDLIVESSAQNQFLISTHSSQVLRHLGSLPSSQIYQVKADQRSSWPPKSSVHEVKPEPAARGAVLIDLGYELRDFEFFDGWLFLEEASAESIIRDHLIPWFAPKLSGRLRTVSARGASRVKPTFDDFNRLVLFTHLEERYRNRAWVLIDGDDTGQRIVDEIRRTYERTWDPGQFKALQQGQFEHYYPQRFSAQADAVLDTLDARQQRELKKELLEEVLAWIDTDPDGAKQEFADSAAEVISILREIEAVVAADGPS
jgi:predicted ATP-dependent endonuclease of OLD family